MATRTSLYLTGDIEEELTARARQRFGSGGATSLGHVITRNLNLYFSACRSTRSRLAETFTYEEMRFLCSFVRYSNLLGDIDDLEQYHQFAADIHLHWVDKEEEGKGAGGLTQELIERAYEIDQDWTYYKRIDPQVLEDKLKVLLLFEVIALVDGLRTALGAERPQRELFRLFRGLRQPA